MQPTAPLNGFVYCGKMKTKQNLKQVPGLVQEQEIYIWSLYEAFTFSLSTAFSTISVILWWFLTVNQESSEKFKFGPCGFDIYRPFFCVVLIIFLTMSLNHLPL